jgi:hypothetical protein
VHQNHAGIAIGFVAIFAEVTDLIPFLQVHASDKKTAHLAKPEGSLEKWIGCAHSNPL